MGLGFRKFLSAASWLLCSQVCNKVGDRSGGMLFTSFDEKGVGTGREENVALQGTPPRIYSLQFSPTPQIYVTPNNASNKESISGCISCYAQHSNYPLSSPKSLSESRNKPSCQHMATFHIKSNSVSISSPSELKKWNLNALNNFVKATQVTRRTGV